MSKKRTNKVSTLLSNEEKESLEMVMDATNSSKSKALRDALNVYSWLITASMRHLEGTCDLDDILPPDVTLYLADQ